MIKREFFKAGHLPTLFAAFFYFDMAFMVWVILGPLGVQIAKSLDLDPAQKGMMVAVPLLSGALLRVVNGLLVDHIKPKLTGVIGQVIVLAGLATAWLHGIQSYHQVLALGVVLGVAGASFAVALPLASRWYPPEYQGIALGIAGAGNSGTVFAAMFAPKLAVALGWINVLGLAMIPLSVALIVYLGLAKNSPNEPKAKSMTDYLSVLKIGDAWWFMLFYGVTFGGFSGLTSSLTIFFNAEYGLSPVQAGYFTAAAVFAGSLVRPVGGAVADRFGGVRSLSAMYIAAAVALVVASFKLPNAYGELAVFVCGVSIGAAALSQRNRRDDRTRRHDGRGRRFLSCVEPWLCQATHGVVSGWAVDLCRAGVGGPGRTIAREAPLAHHLGCCWGNGGKNLKKGKAAATPPVLAGGVAAFV
jgi:NNP family nitrate/nitrite transporter-like MFS transporter